MEHQLLTYNIQAGIGTGSYGQYLSQVHHQVIHTQTKSRTLGRIANLLMRYDIVCLQEIDLGGRRSGFRNQVERIAEASGHNHFSLQENRVVGKISRHGNAVLSRYKHEDVQDLKLPGSKPGRGALLVKVCADPKPVWVMNVHLSLGIADQMEQVKFIADHAPTNSRLIICGDFNCSASSAPVKYLTETLGIDCHTKSKHKSYPSWNPRKDYDHILTSRSLHSEEVDVLPVRYSDHRPVSLIVES
ncbi:endonuclease/exonuclease/phosphatase family protein [Robiginitomaculum antarcticum]|uniref:endonuclease/exonuclease/phosphatase family protein n=1 Tax=Robiginitomaculum antarcticum TaxID=437507 RepID=UPI0003720386|nr:endonuclease/exonuclease/phosphatase family protein [Robiginitomaculum antarcticum]